MFARGASPAYYVLVVVAGCAFVAAELWLGFQSARGANLLISLVAAAAVIMLVATNRLSLWTSFALFALVAVGLGRLYIVLGPNPLNSERLQQAGFLGFMALAAMERLSRGERVAPPFALLGALLVYALAVGSGAVMNAGEISDRTTFGGMLEPILFGPVVFFAAFWFHPGVRQARQLLLLLFVMGILQALLAWFQMLDPRAFDDLVLPFDPLTSLSSVRSHYVAFGRAFSVWQHAPAFGAFMACVIPAALFGVGRTTGMTRLLCLLGAAVVVSGLLLSGSIAPIAAALICVVVYALVVRGRRIVPKLALGLAMLAVAALVVGQVLKLELSGAPVVSRVLDAWALGGVALSYETRMALYEFQLGMWERSPWWGIGLGQFHTTNAFLFTSDAHSALFQMLVERGLLGVAGFGLLLAALVRGNLYVLRLCADRDAHLTYLTLSLISLAILLASVTDYAFNQRNFHLLFWLCQGTVCSASVVSSREMR